jgi:hypothetical protein
MFVKDGEWFALSVAEVWMVCDINRLSLSGKVVFSPINDFATLGAR